MKSYSVPAMAFQNEFADLGFVGGYVDALLASTHDQDYAIVLEWDDRGPGDYPPMSALRRIPNGWQHLAVVVHCVPMPNNAYLQTFTLEEHQSSVNGH